MAKYQYHYNNIKADFPDQIDEIEFLLEFFSDEFAKKDIKDDSDYKISAAYTNIAINNRNYAGVLYPSVRSDYQGYNIALTIPAVENCLDLELAAMVKIHKNKNETLMENIALATDLGNLKSDFKWVSIKGTDEDYINKKIFDY